MARLRMHQVGFTATGVQDILADADVPKGSFYYYFPSKEALALEIIDAYAEERTALLRAKLLEDPASPLSCLAAYFRSASDALWQRGCLLGNVGTEMAYQSDAIRERVGLRFAEWTALVADCLRSAQALGEVSPDLDAEAVAAFCLNSWEGALMRMKVDRSRAPLKTFATMFFGNLLGTPRFASSAHRSAEVDLDS
jgi:TetR/AcrR family transcriptional regulator, transcriptional repressor for nem operon